MQLAKFTGNRENITVFKPIAGLHITNVYRGTKIRVRLLDSDKGSNVELVPSLPVELLFEVSTYGEGSFVGAKSGSDEVYHGYVKLSEDAIDLSNNRYLSIDVIQPKANSLTTVVYGFESPDSPINWAFKYAQIYVAAGELSKSFQSGENETLCIPISESALNGAELDEVQLYTKNGTSPVYTREELRYMALQNNDIVKVWFDSEGNNTIQDGYSSDYAIIDLEEVVSFDVKFKNNSTGCKLTVVDTKQVN